MKKCYCPNCGYEMTGKKDTQYGVVCPKCHNDFWISETLPENYKKLGLQTINNLIKRR